jgi:hypothetical protein
VNARPRADIGSKPATRFDARQHESNAPGLSEPTQPWA